MPHPTVAVIVATLDEQSNIDHVLDIALASSHVIQVIVADGGSTDDTVRRVADRAARDPRVTLIDNPHRVQSAGLNLAACRADADILVRLDAHTSYEERYVDASVDAWRQDRAVGGAMRAEGSTAWSEATAYAMDDPMAIGPARFHHATRAEDVDTVYLGAFERKAFLEVGGYRTFPSGTVEDTDFYARWRRSGRIVRVDPTIRSRYHPRNHWHDLAVQYARYGRGKGELLWVNRQLPSLRPLAPAALVAAITPGTPLAWVGWWLPVVLVIGVWAIALAVIGARAPSRRLRTALVAATMHAAYGLGLWVGVLSGPPTVHVLGMNEAINRS